MGAARRTTGQGGLPWPRSERGRGGANEKRDLESFLRTGTVNRKSVLPREGDRKRSRISAASVTAVRRPQKGGLVSAWPPHRKWPKAAPRPSWGLAALLPYPSSLRRSHSGDSACRPSGEAVRAPRSGPHQRCIGPYECFLLLLTDTPPTRQRDASEAGAKRE